MTFPTVTESGGVSALSSSHTLTLPSYSTGDLLIVHNSTEDSGNAQTWTFNGSTSAFTQLFNSSYGPAGVSVAKYRVMEAGDSGSLVIALSSTARQLPYSFFVIPAGTFSGVPEAAGGAWGYTSNPDPPSLTPSWGLADTLWLSLCYGDGSISAYPTNYSALGWHDGNTAVGSGQRNYTASVDDPSAWTFGGWYAGAATIAIKPASIDTPPYIALRGAPSSATTYNETSITVNLPSGHVSGDVLVLMVANNYSAGPSVTDPAGWTLLTSAQSGQARQKTYWRLDNGSLGATVTVTTSSGGNEAICVAFSGASQSAPVAAQYGASTATSATVDFPALGTWAVSNGIDLAFASFYLNGGSSNPANPAGYSDGPTVNDVYWGKSHLSYKSLSGVTTVGALSATWTVSSANIGAHVFIKEIPETPVAGMPLSRQLINMFSG